jgi:ATP-binding cassette subfamily C protein
VFVLAFGRLSVAGLRLQEAFRNLLHSVPGYSSAIRLIEHCRSAAGPAASAPKVIAWSTLSIESVSFRHPQAARPALSGVSAEIRFGTMAAIMGPTGAGKSTLADLILGLIQPGSGQILVDGQALTGEFRQSWKGNVGYVAQDAFLFHDTVRANLLFAAPSASEADLWEALGTADLAAVIRSLPDGLDSVVGDRGGRLSGGERQRLTLARALLRKPSLLLLDEFTSGLDGQTEQRLLESLHRLKPDMAIIATSHRPAVASAADQVIRLENGNVAEIISADRGVGFTLVPKRRPNA